MEALEMSNSFLAVYEFLKNTTLPLFGIDFRLIDYFYITSSFVVLSLIFSFYRGENNGTN